MQVIYMADDGTQFTDEWECEEYEWILNHPALKDISLFTKDGEQLNNFLSEDTYNCADIVVIQTKDALDTLIELAEYTGFSCYESISKVGTWKFNELVAEYEEE